MEMEMEEILLEDDFSGLDVGMFSAPVGAHTEYHFLPEAAPKGNWTVACFVPEAGSQRAWHVQERDGSRVMAQTFDNAREYSHPTLVTGDERWRDYAVSVRFAPETRRAQSGVVFRYRNSRCYYFFGFRGDEVVLKMVRHAADFHQPYEEVLAQQECDWSPGAEYAAAIAARGNHIRAEIEGLVVLEADDGTYAQGKVGLMADVPTRYAWVQVRTPPAERERVHVLRSRQERELDEFREANPKPVLWKKVSTEGFGVGRNLRFGDLSGDGQADVLVGQMVHHGSGDGYSELSCLTAMTFDGEILWQIGRPDPENYHLTNDVGFQIHDIDGDGRNEVVYCMGMEIAVVDGRTGKEKYRAPTPESKPPADRYPRILGDCLFFGDFRGRGRSGDLVIKDRYWHFWVLDDRLEAMWEGECRTGHYPFAFDIDGDGCDELAIGYALFDHDGRLLWNLEDEIQDHADGVAIVDFMAEEGSEPKVFYAGSDAGVAYVDLEGRILKRHFIGHAQNPAIARFRPDLPGLQVVSINFWGNQGILHFFDAGGEIYHDCEPNPFGSMCLPISWTGKEQEYFVHSPNVTWGGMFDGWGRPVVAFPEDGHPEMCNAVLDITGDCRDEVVVWDPGEIWVYTQDDSPREGRLYKPRRNPLHNYSNYQASVSLPGWSE